MTKLYPRGVAAPSRPPGGSFSVSRESAGWASCSDLAPLCPCPSTGPALSGLADRAIEITQASDVVPADAGKLGTRHPQPVTGESRERRPGNSGAPDMVAGRTPAQAKGIEPSSEPGVTAGETAPVDSEKGRGSAEPGCYETLVLTDRTAALQSIGLSWPGLVSREPGGESGRPFSLFAVPVDRT